MKHRVTLAAATIAGLAGFGWTLFTYTPPPEPPRAGWSEGAGYAQPPTRWSSGPVSDPIERISQLKEQLQQDPEDASAWHQLGWAQHTTGDAVAAVESWTKAAAIQLAGASPQSDNGYLYDLACYQALSGDREGALASWVRCVDAGWNRSRWASQDVDLDSIRSDPRFEEAFKRIVPRSRGTGQLNAG